MPRWVNTEGGGPLFVEGREQDKQRDGVAAGRHAGGEREGLPFCSTHAQRSEHVDDRIVARLQERVRWNDDSAVRVWDGALGGGGGGCRWQRGRGRRQG